MLLATTGTGVGFGASSASAETTLDLSVDHPRLMWSIDELESLQANVRSGWLSDAFAATKSQADRWLDGNGSVPVSARLGRLINDRVNTLAITGYLTGDDAYLDAAVRHLVYNAERFDPDDLVALNGHLAVGDATHAFAVGYDWLYPHMSPEERALVRKTVEKFGARIYQEGWYSTPDSFNSATNHNSVVNGGLGLAALALGDRDDWLQRAITNTRAYFNYSMDADGWNFEGSGYWGYGNWGALAFAASLERLGGPDLVDEQPKMANVTVDYFLRRMPPYSPNGRGMGLTMYMIGKYDDAVGLWGWLRAFDKETGDGSYGAGQRSPYILLWADPDLEPAHPGRSGVPLDKFFASDRAVVRDGWEESSGLVTFTTGWTRHSGHRMRRDNSFTFHALGEDFAISPPEIMTRMEVLHNLVMVGEPRRSRSAGEHPYGAEFLEVRQSEDAVYIKSDATESAVYYNTADGWMSPGKRKVSYAQRQLLFGRDPGGSNQPYLLVIDDLESRNEEPVTFSWLLQTAPDNEPVLDGRAGGGPNRYKVIGARRGATLHVEFLQPGHMTIRERSHDALNEIKGRLSDQQIKQTLRTITAETTGSNVRIEALLMATEPGEPRPDVEYSETEDGSRVAITFADGTRDVIRIEPDDLIFERTRDSARSD